MRITSLILLLCTLMAFTSCGEANTNEATEQEANTTLADAPAVPAGAQTFQILPKSSSVAWVGKKFTGSQHNGTIALKSGQLSMAEGTLVGGSFILDMANGIKVEDIEDVEKNGKLTGHLKSDDFFGSETHPEAVFTITSVAAIESEEDHTHQISGNLSLKGITHEVSFPAIVGTSAERIEATAAFEIDRTRWDVMFRSGLEAFGDKTILDEVPLTIKLVAVSDSEGMALQN